VVVLTGFVMCGYIYIYIYIWGCMRGCFGNCVGVLVICMLIFTVFLYCFVNVRLFLCVLSVLV
jgi:hypothetical protein